MRSWHPLSARDPLSLHLAGVLIHEWGLTNSTSQQLFGSVEALLIEAEQQLDLLSPIKGDNDRRLREICEHLDIDLANLDSSEEAVVASAPARAPALAPASVPAPALALALVPAVEEPKAVMLMVCTGGVVKEASFKLTCTVSSLEDLKSKLRVRLALEAGLAIDVLLVGGLHDSAPLANIDTLPAKAKMSMKIRTTTTTTRLLLPNQVDLAVLPKACCRRASWRVCLVTYCMRTTGLRV